MRIISTLILLLAAAAVSGATGDPTDAVIITAIVVLSVGLAFMLETEHILYECVGALYHALGMFRFHDNSFQYN